MKKRSPKKTDQENTKKAFKYLIQLIEQHEEDIEPSLWLGAMIAALADNFELSDIPFVYFKEEMNEAIEHYKY